MWETFTERIPYDGWAPLKIASDVAYQKRRPEMTSAISPDVQWQIQQCWGEDPEERSVHKSTKSLSSRPTFDEIVTRIEDSIVAVQVGAYDDDTDDGRELSNVVSIGSIQ